LNNDKSKSSPIVPLIFGAAQENGFRPGTENTPMIIGLGQAALQVYSNWKTHANHMKLIRDYLEECLIRQFGADNLLFNGRSINVERIPNTCNVSFIGNEKFKGHAILNNCKILEAGTGSCCHSNESGGSRILISMQVGKRAANNAIRISVGRDTTKEQIDTIVDDLKNSISIIENNSKDI
jgi:cysteine sulfinate desulfinase/cysteine desulfurase-like protein